MIKTIIWTILQAIVIVIVFAAGYTLAHQKVAVPPIDKAIDKVSNFCGDKK